MSYPARAEDHVWKWHNVQRARSEFCRCTTHALYRSKLSQQDHCQHLQNNKDVPRVMKPKFPATVMVFGVVSSEGHIMPPHIFEVGLKVNTKMYLYEMKSMVIPWCNHVAGGRPWVWQQDSAPAHKSKETQASEGMLRLCTLLSLAPSSPDLNPLDYFVWSYVENITGITSRNAKASLIAEYSSSIRRRLWKRHALSSGSVSRRWLRLKVATLNICQLYYIIKLPELIFSMKVFKIKP